MWYKGKNKYNYQRNLQNKKNYFPDDLHSLMPSMAKVLPLTLKKSKFYFFSLGIGNVFW
jgi:hypothetical protein